MCCNGDGSPSDDDEWRAVSGALRIRNGILMIYTKTREDGRISWATGRKNCFRLMQRLRKARRKRSCRFKPATQTTAREMRGWLQTRRLLEENGFKTKKKFFFFLFCTWKFKNNAPVLCMQPLPSPDAIKICSLQTQKTSTLTSQVLQHEQICTSNRLISHCAWPVNHRRIFRAKSRARAHKAIFDDTLAHGETLSNSLASRREGPGESQPLNWRAKFFFPHAEKAPRLWSSEKGGSSESLSRYQPHQ